VRDETVVVCGLIEAVLFGAPEYEHGIVPAFFPEIAAETAKEVNSVKIPRPPEIIGKVSERCQWWGKRWNYGEGVIRAQHALLLSKKPGQHVFAGDPNTAMLLHSLLLSAEKSAPA
jgi:hypothetical protein